MFNGGGVHWNEPKKRIHRIGVAGIALRDKMLNYTSGRITRTRYTRPPPRVYHIACTYNGTRLLLRAKKVRINNNVTTRGTRETSDRTRKRFTVFVRVPLTT